MFDQLGVAGGLIAIMIALMWGLFGPIFMVYFVYRFFRDLRRIANALERTAYEQRHSPAANIAPQPVDPVQHHQRVALSAFGR